jgi:hypothetical protein
LNRIDQLTIWSDHMTHPLIEQLRFARYSFERGIEGVTVEEGRQRFMPMNSISWIVGHLANHEQRSWFLRRGLEPIAPELNDLVGTGMPATTPSIEDMWSAWREITTASDAWLDSLDGLAMESYFDSPGPNESLGTSILRVTYHYWYHLGEASAIRQLLGHTDLPRFVGPIGDHAPYRG